MAIIVLLNRAKGASINFNLPKCSPAALFCNEYFTCIDVLCMKEFKSNLTIINNIRNTFKIYLN